MNNNNDKLQAEILETIMFYLSLRDKSNCLQACKAWYQHSSQVTWFDTLFLQDNDRLIQAQEFFTEKPHLGRQIKHLSLIEEASATYGRVLLHTITKIPDFLPNIKTLKCNENELPQIYQTIIWIWK